MKVVKNLKNLLSISFQRRQGKCYCFWKVLPSYWTCMPIKKFKNCMQCFRLFTG